MGKGIVTFSNLGKWGRFANQVFQYAFLKIYATRHDLVCQTPEWIGRFLFGHNDPRICFKFKTINDDVSLPNFSKDPYNGKTSALASGPCQSNIDIVGYFQYHTSYYVPYANIFRSLYRPVGKAKDVVDRIEKHIMDKGKTLISIHLRRGDYGTFKHQSARCFFRAPCDWYIKWLEDNWNRFDSPILYIASDSLDETFPQFKKYNPICSKDASILLPEAPYYIDFYMISCSDVTLVSNSSFSFAASMLNEKGREFYRPRYSLKKLIPYSPWNAHTIFRDEGYTDNEIVSR